MIVAITGGTGFVGRHLAEHLASRGHEVVLVARGVDQRDVSVVGNANVRWLHTSVDDADALAAAFEGVDAVVHCAGINRELGTQTYERVHVEGTRSVVAASKRAGIRKLVMLSFLRARPDCGSAYHESKWAAEEIVRASELDYTIVKAGMIFGRGDHMLDHLSHALHSFPIWLRVGFDERPVRPVSVHDVVRILAASLVDTRLSRTTVAVVGPEELRLSDAAARVGALIGHRRISLPVPVFVVRAVALVSELVMRVPLVSRAQVRMLAEGVADPLPGAQSVPDDLLPSARFEPANIAPELPPPGGFGIDDLRCRRAVRAA
jgi:uncharacterized protein YbjT (DUF2867 family)